MSHMTLQFLGAARTVTGSKYLIEYEGRRILIDCGLFQGLKELRLKNREKFPIDPSQIDAVVLTHAHIDHTGYLPVLARGGFRGKIICTPATRDLCRILLPDSGRLQEEEAQYANKKGFSKHHPALPLYTQEDAERVLEHFEVYDYGREFSPVPGLKARFSPSGHILGSAFITVTNGVRSILFTGDLGRPKDLLLKPPVKVEQADYLVVESTYGNRQHGRDDLLDQLETIINRTVTRNGVIVVPAFSVGRSQMLLYALYLLRKDKRIPFFPVYLNSPMSVNATGIFCDYHGEHALNPQQCEGMCEVSSYVRTPEQSKALNQKTGPMLIISASGMATGGRVLHHLKAFAPDTRNTILLTGYQAEGTRGAALVHGAKALRIHGQDIPVRAEVALLHGLSAHADQKEIIDWMSGFSGAPRRTFITHGELGASEALQAAIEQRLRWTCEVPSYLQKVDLV